MEIFLWLIGFLATFVYFLQRGFRLALFRTVGWVLSVAVILTLNVNWLLERPITMSLLGLGALAGIGLTFLWRKKTTSRKMIFPKIKLVTTVPILVFLGAFVLGWQYLGFRWDTPRYATPDPGTHTMFMFQTAQTGIMPIFSESRIYPASGYAQGWKTHHLTSPPGSTAVFFVFDQLSPLTSLETFQLLNVLIYALVCGYFFALSMGLLRGVWRYLSFGVFSFVLLYGIFFELVMASFSTQSLGLLFLLFFVDMYHRYRQGKVPIWFSMFALASICVTYIFWLPVAFLFIFFERLSDLRERGFSFRSFFLWSANSLVVPVGSLLLAWGYVLVAYKVNIVGYASADGGFPVQKEILRDCVLVIPFALFSVYLLVRRWWLNGKANLILNLLLASFLFSFALIFLYAFAGKASHYTAFKSLYLLLPLVWVLALSQMVQVFSFFRDVLREKNITLDLIRFRKWGLFFAGFYLLVFLGTSAVGISWKVFSLQKQNMVFASGGGNIGAILKPEQAQLLDAINRDYRDILRDGRVFVVAPPDTALFIFSYSGIWPRTASTGDPKDIPLKGFDLNALKTIKYKEWFERDPDRVLVFFRTQESSRWLEKEGIPLEEYETIFSVGENAIYKWKGNKK